MRQSKDIKHWNLPCFQRAWWASSEIRQFIISSSSFIGLPSWSRSSRQLHKKSIVSSPLSHHAVAFHSSEKPIFSYRAHFNLLNSQFNNCANRTHCNYRIIGFFKGRAIRDPVHECRHCFNPYHTFWTKDPPPLLGSAFTSGWNKKKMILVSVNIKACQGHRRGNSSFGI